VTFPEWVDKMVALHPWACFGVFVGTTAMAAGLGGMLGARYPQGLRAAIRERMRDAMTESDTGPDIWADCDCRTEHEHLMRGHIR
jgi:hypothetical protein